MDYGGIKAPEGKDWLKKIFDVRLVVVEVRPEESEEEAWSRHLTEHPRDIYANIRVFNRQPIGLTSNFC